MITRPAVPADAEPVAHIWHQGWRDGHLGHVPAELVAVRTEESFHTRASQRIPDTTVAEVNGEIAGFTMVEADEVEQLYVDSRHRGSGVAAALLADAARQVKENGHQHAWLAVAAGNAKARRFYERQGWNDEGLFDYPARTETGTVAVPCHRYVLNVAQ